MYFLTICNFPCNWERIHFVCSAGMLVTLTIKSQSLRENNGMEANWTF